MDETYLNNLTFLVGNRDEVSVVYETYALPPFSDKVMDFLTELSGVIMSDTRSRLYPDVVTYAFWIRKASVNKLAERFKSNDHRLGRGVAFHIAPSNVPVNFAYSLTAGLLMGNLNIVRVPTKEFEQVSIIADAINSVLNNREEMKPYIILVRYGHDKEINDAFSRIADTRIVWGGDKTIENIRKSPLPSRSTEVLFADRYSIAIIDSDIYMATDNKNSVAEAFYNDTYLTDQNACTSPKMVIWTGSAKKEAKEIFWNMLHDLVKKKYTYRDIQSVDKLTMGYLAAVKLQNTHIVASEDNLITRISVYKPNKLILELMGNSGFFFEYDCDDVMELWDICNDKRCQTVGMIGDKKWIMPLIRKGIKGIDRIVDIGHTMDFDLIWDGYDLSKVLTREITFG